VISVGVAGLGPAGQIHAANIAKLPNARLHAVASRRGDVAQDFARRYRVPRTYTEYADLFGDPELDAVVIASGCAEHPDHIVEAARCGRHIFTEKPLGITLGDIDRALAAVHRAGVHLQVGFMRRFDPGYAAAKRRIDEGAIGRPVLFRSTSRDPFFPKKQESQRYNTTLLDLGVHDFDLARWLMGTEVSTVYTVGGALVYPELRESGDVDNAVIGLTFENEAIGAVDLSRNARYGYDVRTEILGDEGALLVGGLHRVSLLMLSRRGATQEGFSWYAERFAEAFVDEVAHFVDALETGRTPAPGGHDGRRASEIGRAAVESWQAGTPVAVARLPA
jgi:scyllo-inositol 2-dehydrogenase (NAD+)